MWILSQDKEKVVNANMVSSLELNFRGNVGIISVNYKAIPVEIGEYRDYAARKIFNEIAILLPKGETYFMPEEETANMMYKDKEVANE